MAAGRKKKDASEDTSSSAISDQLTEELISDINKEFGTRVAYNLSEANAPTIVKSWIGSRSLLLDYAISNKRNGGYPVGRVIEVSGLPSTGKSHLAYEAARTVQEQGGLVVYVDTENATPVEKLATMGIDVRKRFVYVDTHCTEEVFSIIDSIIRKTKPYTDKGLPVLAIWDSVAGTSPKAELEGDYDTSTVGLQARMLSKGMRKITGVIAQMGVTLFCINQLRQKIGVNFGDPYVTPGGAAIPYHSSVRVRLTGEGTALKDKFGNVIGIKVPLRIIKNKVAPPFRSFSLEIHFGRGIVETDSLIDAGIEYCEKHKYVLRGDKQFSITGKGKAWKTFLVADNKSGEVLYEKKFQKDDFDDLLHKDDVCSPLMKEFYDGALTVVFGEPEGEHDINPVSDEDDMGDQDADES
jgi:recombination protein RecA